MKWKINKFKNCNKSCNFSKKLIKINFFSKRISLKLLSEKEKMLSLDWKSSLSIHANNSSKGHSNFLTIKSITLIKWSNSKIKVKRILMIGLKIYLLTSTRSNQKITILSISFNIYKKSTKSIKIYGTKKKHWTKWHKKKNNSLKSSTLHSPVNIRNLSIPMKKISSQIINLKSET